MTKKTIVATAGSSALAFVLTMGIVNLFADVTYEGAASINGPGLARGERHHGSPLRSITVRSRRLLSRRPDRLVADLHPSGATRPLLTSTSFIDVPSRGDYIAGPWMTSVVIDESSWRAWREQE